MWPSPGRCSRCPSRGLASWGWVVRNRCRSSDSRSPRWLEVSSAEPWDYLDDAIGPPSCTAQPRAWWGHGSVASCSSSSWGRRSKRSLKSRRWMLFVSAPVSYLGPVRLSARACGLLARGDRELRSSRSDVRDPIPRASSFSGGLRTAGDPRLERCRRGARGRGRGGVGPRRGHGPMSGCGVPRSVGGRSSERGTEGGEGRVGACTRTEGRRHDCAVAGPRLRGGGSS